MATSTPEDVAMIDVAVPSHNTLSKPPKGQDITTMTIKTPPFAYAYVELISLSTDTPLSLDLLTAHQYLTAALTQFLGLTGAAIPVDLLRLEGATVWIRCPREDLPAVLAAVGGWVGKDEGTEVGWTVRGSGNWLGRLIGQVDAGKVWE